MGASVSISSHFSNQCGVVRIYLLAGRALSKPARSYLAVYAGLVCVADVTHAVSVVTYNLGAIRASRTLHEQLVDSIARSTFRSVYVFLRWTMGLSLTPFHQVARQDTGFKSHR